MNVDLLFGSFGSQMSQSIFELKDVKIWEKNSTITAWKFLFLFVQNWDTSKYLGW